MPLTCPGRSGPSCWKTRKLWWPSLKVEGLAAVGDDGQAEAVAPEPDGGLDVRGADADVDEGGHGSISWLGGVGEGG